MPATRATPPPPPPGTWAAGVAAATGVTLEMARWGQAVLCYAPVAAAELLAQPGKDAVTHGGPMKPLAAEGCAEGIGTVEAGRACNGAEHSSGATAVAPAGAQAAAAPATRDSSCPADSGRPELQPGTPATAGTDAVPDAVSRVPAAPPEATMPSAAYAGSSSAPAAAAGPAHEQPGGSELGGFGGEEALVPPCAICDEALAGRDVALFPCGHYFCDVCARQHLASQHACPTCRAKAKPANVFRCRHRRQAAAPRGEDPSLVHVRHPSHLQAQDRAWEFNLPLFGFTVLPGSLAAPCLIVPWQSMLLQRSYAGLAFAGACVWGVGEQD